jgi:hypothetical protein
MDEAKAASNTRLASVTASQDIALRSARLDDEIHVANFAVWGLATHLVRLDVFDDLGRQSA